jgi:hypothetical protein
MLTGMNFPAPCVILVSAVGSEYSTGPVTVLRVVGPILILI